MGKFDKYLFHASSLGAIMTEPRSGPGLSETCKAHLMECWIQETYKREKDIENKYLRKGLEVEEDSITLYSRARKRFFRKNTELLFDDYVVGTPDLEDESEDEIIDIKSSWDIFTFHANIYKPVNKNYGWQISAYCSLKKRKSGRLVYCLVDTPGHMIEKEKQQLMWKMGVIDPDAHPLYLEACEKIDRQMTFDDIPLERRYIEFMINPAQYPMDRAYARIEECREFMNALDGEEDVTEKLKKSITV